MDQTLRMPFLTRPRFDWKDTHLRDFYAAAGVDVTIAGWDHQPHALLLRQWIDLNVGLLELGLKQIWIVMHPTGRKTAFYARLTKFLANDPQSGATHEIEITRGPKSPAQLEILPALLADYYDSMVDGVVVDERELGPSPRLTWSLYDGVQDIAPVFALVRCISSKQCDRAMRLCDAVVRRVMNGRLASRAAANRLRRVVDILDREGPLATPSA